MGKERVKVGKKKNVIPRKAGSASQGGIKVFVLAQALCRTREGEKGVRVGGVYERYFKPLRCLRSR